MTFGGLDRRFAVRLGNFVGRLARFTQGLARRLSSLIGCLARFVRRFAARFGGPAIRFRARFLSRHRCRSLGHLPRGLCLSPFGECILAFLRRWFLFRLGISHLDRVKYILIQTHANPAHKGP